MRLIQQVRNKFITWRVSRAFRVLDKYKVSYIIPPSSDVNQLVQKFVQQVEEKFGNESGEFKRAQVMRAVMNSDPSLKERDIAFAIEVAVRV